MLLFLSFYIYSINHMTQLRQRFSGLCSKYVELSC
jgi:hypothetical protein